MICCLEIGFVIFFKVEDFRCDCDKMDGGGCWGCGIGLRWYD